MGGGRGDHVGRGGPVAGWPGERALGCRLEVERTEPRTSYHCCGPAFDTIRPGGPTCDNGSFAAMFRFYGTERFFPDHLIITS